MFADQVNRSFGKADRERKKMQEKISSLEGRDLERLLKEAEERAHLAEEGRRAEEQKARSAEEKLRRLEEKATEVGVEAEKVRAEMVQTTDALRRKEEELNVERDRADGLKVQLDRATTGARDLRSLLERMEERAVQAEIRASDNMVETYFGGFRVCEKQVKGKYPELDLSFLDTQEVEEEPESEPEGAVAQEMVVEVPAPLPENAEVGSAEHPANVEHPSDPEVMIIDPEGAD